MLAIILAVIFGSVMMFLGLAKIQNLRRYALVMSVILALTVAYSYATGFELSFENFFDFYASDKVRYFFMLMMSIGFVAYLVLFGKSLDHIGRHDGEVYALLFFVICGVFQILMYKHLLSLFLGIETLSIPLYILAGSDKENIKSNEASLKYFLMGAFTTGILLMGIALLYGATGSFDLNASKVYFSDAVGNSMAIMGVAMIIIALGFKSSLVPFHFWTPDVYDGAPTPITAFMATIVKSTIVFAFYIFITHTTGAMYPKWQIILAILAAATLILGNITAVYQRSTKRMLAYSSIAQAGFMILPIVAFGDNTLEHLALYMGTYIMANLGIFAVVDKLHDYTFDGFLGLGKKSPQLAFIVTVFLISLAGLPVSGGFFAKLFAIMHVMNGSRFIWLGVIALLMAAVGVYYYFRPIWSMYFKNGDAAPLPRLSSTQILILVVFCVMILILGIYPDLLVSCLA